MENEAIDTFEQQTILTGIYLLIALKLIGTWVLCGESIQDETTCFEIEKCSREVGIENDQNMGTKSAVEFSSLTRRWNLGSSIQSSDADRKVDRISHDHRIVLFCEIVVEVYNIAAVYPKEYCQLYDPVDGGYSNIFAADFKTVDHVVMVSHGCAWELKIPGGSWGFYNIINENDWKLRGIVNGTVSGFEHIIKFVKGAGCGGKGNLVAKLKLFLERIRCKMKQMLNNNSIVHLKRIKCKMKPTCNLIFCSSK
ncbi:hypothetical protein GH714_032986 [Hevea brasiliensis]|uniref:Uncharacterized protein n=1 Tax=Hevea brasiliensis TaxID=3981 RepID=A0A6A6N5T7_HEVBR|nr:hypothetical protein GH714_032986 [Hevea brasiliensis]